MKIDFVIKTPNHDEAIPTPEIIHEALYSLQKNSDEMGVETGYFPFDKDTIEIVPSNDVYGFGVPSNHCFAGQLIMDK